MVMDFLRKIGKAHFDKMVEENPINGEEGMYVNVGTTYNEEWVWRKPLKMVKPIYVNFYWEGDTLIVSYDHYPRANALESMQAANIEEAMLLGRYTYKYHNEGKEVTFIDRTNGEL